MRFAMLGSGSKGNATIIDAGGTRILVDCGFAVQKMRIRAERISFDLASLDAILVTHEHGDHLGGVSRMARAFDVPVYMTAGTFVGWKDHKVPSLQIINPHQNFTVGAITVQPIAVPHDAREPCQFALSHQGKKLGILSDLGHVTPHVQQALHDCDALLLETNHDPHMLRIGPYSAELKARVGGDYGHLANGQSAALVRTLTKGRLQQLVLTHLSEQNNTPLLARAAICEALQDDPVWCQCADQEHGIDWRSVS